MVDEIGPDDPGSEDTVPVLEAGSNDDGSAPLLLVVAFADTVDEVEIAEPVIVDIGEPSEVSVEPLLLVDVINGGEPKDD